MHYPKISVESDIFLKSYGLRHKILFIVKCLAKYLLVKKVVMSNFKVTGDGSEISWIEYMHIHIIFYKYTIQLTDKEI